MRRIFLMATVAAAARCAAAQEAPAARATLDSESRQAVALTVYGNNFALVRETRSANLPAGASELELRGVAEKIDPASASLRAADGKGELTVTGQSFRFDALNAQSLLQRFVGKRVIVANYPTGAGEGKAVAREGTLLSVSGGNVVRFNDDGKPMIEINPPGTLRFPDPPSDLSATPSLVWSINNAAAGERKIEVSYLAADVTWRAEYLARLAEGDVSFDLTGWAAVTNNSGASYPAARLKLVAGDLKRAADPSRPPRDPRPRAMAVAGAAAQVDEGIDERSFADSHLYEVARPVSLASGETRQIALMEAHGVPAKKVFLFEGAPYAPGGALKGVDKRKLAVVLEADNLEASRLGLALPRGRVRVTKADADGAIEMVGEDSIDHTPQGGKLRLRVGEATDVTGERVQTNFNRLGDRTSELTYRITIHNATKEDIDVRVVEKLYGDWKITQSSLEPVKRDSTTAEFSLPLKAGADAVIDYTVRIDF